MQSGGMGINMAKDIFKEIRTPLIVETVPKSIFTIEQKLATFTFDNNHPFHYHDWYELYYIKQGSCIYYIGKKKYLVNEGDWVFIPPKTDHKVLYISVPHERWLMYFSKDYLPLELDVGIRKFVKNPIYTPNPEDDERMFDILMKAYNEFSNEDEYSAALYKSYLVELFANFVRKPTYRSNKPDEKETDIFITHIMDYIKYNYAQNISLNNIAAENDISVSYLSKKFKTATGYNLSEYVRAIRINQAKKLLLETDDSISEISEKCGFNDSNYFSYVFKQLENISPLNYRKLHS